jgi:hypothetical protein
MLKYSYRPPSAHRGSFTFAFRPVYGLANEAFASRIAFPRGSAVTE